MAAVPQVPSGRAGRDEGREGSQGSKSDTAARAARGVVKGGGQKRTRRKHDGFSILTIDHSWREHLHTGWEPLQRLVDRGKASLGLVFGFVYGTNALSFSVPVSYLQQITGPTRLDSRALERGRGGREVVREGERQGGYGLGSECALCGMVCALRNGIRLAHFPRPSWVFSWTRLTTGSALVTFGYGGYGGYP